MPPTNPPPPPGGDATVVLRRAAPPVELPPAGILRGVSGDLFGKQFPIRERLLIGRDERCDVVVPYPEVSRQHVRLEVQDGKVILHDLGSANGTLVNGTRVSVTELVNGDDISFHTVRFRFEVPGAAAARSRTEPPSSLPPIPPRTPSAPPPTPAAPVAAAGSARGTPPLAWLILAVMLGVLLGVGLLFI